MHPPEPRNLNKRSPLFKIARRKIVVTSTPDSGLCTFARVGYMVLVR